jgi:hypothetical protein
MQENISLPPLKIKAGLEVEAHGENLTSLNPIKDGKHTPEQSKSAAQKGVKKGAVRVCFTHFGLFSSPVLDNTCGPSLQQGREIFLMAHLLICIYAYTHHDVSGMKWK